MDPDLVQEVMRAMWLVFGAVVGACIGSFTNVVIARVPEGLSVVSPPSRCPKCLTPIRPWQNIPVVSWLVLGGKARCCGTPIAPRYVIVEAIGGMLGFVTVALDGANIVAVLHGLMFLVLVAVAFIDLDTWSIPEVLSRALLPLGLALQVGTRLHGGQALEAAALDGGIAWLSGAAAGFFVLFLVRVSATAIARAAKRIGPDEDAMGTGDEQLLRGIGACVGPMGVFWTLLLGSMQGTLVGLVARVATGGKDNPVGAEVNDPDDDWRPPPGSIPYGPFLALGAIEFVLLGSMLPDLQLVELFRELAG